MAGGGALSGPMGGRLRFPETIRAQTAGGCSRAAGPGHGVPVWRLGCACSRSNPLEQIRSAGRDVLHTALDTRHDQRTCGG